MPDPRLQHRDDHDEGRAHRIRAARRRLTEVEIRRHRLRAEIARLEADGEDEAAARLAEQLRREDPDGLTGFDDPPVDAHAVAVGDDLAPAVAAPDSKIDWTAPERATAPRVPRRVRREKRALVPPPAWSVSLGAHAALLLLLGLASFALPGNQQSFLLASSLDGEDAYDELVEISLDPVAPQELELVEFVEDAAPQPFDEITPVDFAAELAPALLGDLPAAPTAMEQIASDLAGLMTAEPGAASEGSSGRAGRRGSAAQFFGARSEGNRFVFVVDNSGSMTDGRMETTILELLRSIGGMKPQQEFHVLFYSDQVYPMFYPEPHSGLLPATRQNQAALERWLYTVEMCKGDCLTDAMDYAASLEPNAVYLLTDGAYLFNGTGAARTKSRKLAYLTEETAGWGFAVHTLGMTVRDAQAAEGLTLIARAHGGTFTPVGVLPAAAQLAKQKAIPYNRTPGRVWGLNVR